MTEPTFVEQMRAAGRPDLAALMAACEVSIDLIEDLRRINRAILASNEAILHRLNRIEDHLKVE